MEKILHCSDFHLGKDLEVEKKRLKLLCNLLRAEKIKYFIFTGDIVDAGTIAMKCELEMKKLFPNIYGERIKDENNKKERDEEDKISFVSRIEKSAEHIKKYNELLEEQYSQAMDSAVKVVGNFIQNLGISRRCNIIFCCGNHDRIRFINEKKFECENECIDEDNYNDVFNAYDDFCKKMGFDYDHKTSIHEAENITVIIGNSNWRKPEHEETNKMCFSCKEVEACLNEIMKKIEAERKNVFFVVHKPYDDICENVKDLYGNKKWTIKERIDEETVAYLYGDKHSYRTEKNGKTRRFMCGAPLVSNNIHYNLLDYFWPFHNLNTASNFHSHLHIASTEQPIHHTPVQVHWSSMLTHL